MDFARLSKASLTQMLGVTSNHYYYNDVIKTSKVQILSSQCANCPHYALSQSFTDAEYQCEQCKCCHHYQCENIHKSETKKIYVNEKKKYGSKAKLSFAPIKVWIALHFCNPDIAGLVITNLKKLEAITGLARRRIKRAINRLQEQNYIAFSASKNGKNTDLRIMILDYDKMHLTANAGGTGYITFSEDNLTTISEICSINDLRTYLRLYLTCDETSVKKKDTSKTTAKISKRKIKSWLPDYLTFGNIDAMIKKMKRFFTFNISSPTCDADETFNVEIPFENHGRLNYSLNLQYAKEIILELLEEINRLVKYEDGERTRMDDNLKMIDLGIFDANHYWRNKFVLLPNEQSLTDLAKLTVQFGFAKVKNAICNIVKQYHFADKKVKSWGALARKIIQLDL